MSLESARKKLESEYWPLPDEVWDDLVEHCVYEDEDEEDCFMDAARQVLNITKGVLGPGKLTANTAPSKKKGRKPGWTGYYSKSFDERYSLDCFLIAEESKIDFARLMGEEIPAIPTSAELYNRYKSTPDPMWGQPRRYIPKTLRAFERACQRARQEFEGMTTEDSVDWSGQMLVDAFLDKAEGWRKPRTLSDSFQIVRDKRAGNTERRKKLWALIDRLADIYAPETQPVAEKQAREGDVQEKWTLDEDASFEDIMLAIGARQGWPQFRFRSRFTIPAGEESWRQIVSSVPQQDKDDIVAAIAEERRLATAYRERQAAKARKGPSARQF